MSKTRSPHSHGPSEIWARSSTRRAIGEVQVLEGEETPDVWMVPNGTAVPARGLFVAQVVGESMNRRIPNGAFCLFRAPVRRPRSGQVLLVQHRDIRDPDHGGRFTVKIFRKSSAREEGRTRATLSLEPDSTVESYQPMVLKEEGQLSAIAELVEVLPGARSTASGIRGGRGTGGR